VITSIGFHIISNTTNPVENKKMSDTFLRSAASIGLLLLASAAQGESRCDCDVVVDQCRAQITEVPHTSVGSRFHVQADTDHCAIVEWTIDRVRGQTTVWDDGEDIDKVTERPQGGTIEVNSCRICKDNLKDKKPTLSTIMAVCQAGDRTLGKIPVKIDPVWTQAQKSAAANAACQPLIEKNERAQAERCNSAEAEMAEIQDEQVRVSSVPDWNKDPSRKNRYVTLHNRLMEIRAASLDCAFMKRN